MDKTMIQFLLLVISLKVYGKIKKNNYLLLSPAILFREQARTLLQQEMKETG
jgi:hypothetical protein